MTEPTANVPTEDGVSRDAWLDEAKLRRLESDNRLQYTVDYAQSGLKGLFLANGGGILALLTFLGNSDAKVGVNGIFWSFVWFGIGLGFCLSAYFMAAISQNHLMNSTFNEALQCRSNAYNTNETYDFKSWDAKAERASNAAGVLAALSLVMFIMGAFVALAAIT